MSKFPVHNRLFNTSGWKPEAGYLRCGLENMRWRMWQMLEDTFTIMPPMTVRYTTVQSLAIRHQRFLTHCNNMAYATHRGEHSTTHVHWVLKSQLQAASPPQHHVRQSTSRRHLFEIHKRSVWRMSHRTQMSQPLILAEPA